MLIKRKLDSITLEQARDLIAREGKLSKGSFYNRAHNLRCALGVLEDYYKYNNSNNMIDSRSRRDLDNLVNDVTGIKMLVSANDFYEGSTSGRCKFMVRIFNQLIEYKNRGK